MGLPESKAVSPFILGLLEDKVVSRLIFAFPDGAQYLPLAVILNGRAVSLHRWEGSPLNVCGTPELLLLLLLLFFPLIFLTSISRVSSLIPLFHFQTCDSMGTGCAA